MFPVPKRSVILTFIEKRTIQRYAATAVATHTTFANLHFATSFAGLLLLKSTFSLT